MKIYHNPRCSKSRATLALLKEQGRDPEIIRYLDRGLEKDEVEVLAGQLGCSLHDLLRVKEGAYGDHGLGPDSSDDAILAALVESPVLLERPVVVCGDRAQTCRPPELVLGLLTAETS